MLTEFPPDPVMPSLIAAFTGTVSPKPNAWNSSLDMMCSPWVSNLYGGDESTIGPGGFEWYTGPWRLECDGGELKNGPELYDGEPYEGEPYDGEP